MQKTRFTTIPGTRDILPDEVGKWQFLEDLARRVFARYGFEEIRTPLMEPTELFSRGIGGDTDIVQKEMYTFEDQGGSSITLRPEATAAVVRSYIQHHMHRGGGVTKLYYVGPMFRHERKQKGRWRQFHQIGAEVLGTDHPAVESEAIEMLMGYLLELRIPVRLLVNSVGCKECRPGYTELLGAKIRENLPSFCEDCRRRSETNSLRVLDCKVESCQPLIDRLPRITDHLCAACTEHFSRFKEHLRKAGITFEAVPRLVRGLDYYVRTAFEIVSGELGAQNALVGGGRYDGLSEVLGGAKVQGFGFAMGLDRLVMILPEEVQATTGSRPEIFLAYLSPAAFDQAISIARTLRREGFNCSLEFGGGSLKSQMRTANKLRARNVLIIGEEELARQQFTLKQMDDSHQREVSLQELVACLRSRSAER